MSTAVTDATKASTPPHQQARRTGSPRSRSRRGPTTISTSADRPAPSAPNPRTHARCRALLRHGHVRDQRRMAGAPAHARRPLGHRAPVRGVGDVPPRVALGLAGGEPRPRGRGPGGGDLVRRGLVGPRRRSQPRLHRPRVADRVVRARARAAPRAAGGVRRPGRRRLAGAPARAAHRSRVLVVPRGSDHSMRAKRSQSAVRRAPSANGWAGVQPSRALARSFDTHDR